MLRNFVRDIVTRLTTRAQKKIDPWQGGTSSYVYKYRDKLKVAADAIARHRRIKVALSYNKYLKCAEILDPKLEPILRAVVHGEYCSPYAAYVFANGLDDGEKEIVRLAFDGLRTIEFRYRGDRNYPGGMSNPAL